MIDQEKLQFIDKNQLINYLSENKWFDNNYIEFVDLLFQNQQYLDYHGPSLYQYNLSQNNRNQKEQFKRLIGRADQLLSQNRQKNGSFQQNRSLEQNYQSQKTSSPLQIIVDLNKYEQRDIKLKNRLNENFAGHLLRNQYNISPRKELRINQVDFKVDDEFFIDYKVSPSKRNFYKRDYKYHLSPEKPFRFLLGQEERLQNNYNNNKNNLNQNQCPLLEKQMQFHTKIQRNQNQNLKSPCRKLDYSNFKEIDQNYSQFEYCSPQKEQKKFDIAKFIQSPLNNQNQRSNQQLNKNYVQKKMIQSCSVFLEGLDGISMVQNEIEIIRRKISLDEKLSVLKLFNFYKIEGTEYMSGQNFREFFKDLNVLFKEKQIDLILKRFDQNGDRFLDYLEFESIFRPKDQGYNEYFLAKTKDQQNQDQNLNNNINQIVNNNKSKQNLRDLLQLLQEREEKMKEFKNKLKNIDPFFLFQIIEKKGQSYIDFVQFTQFLKEKKFLAPENVYLELFYLFDRNCDGQISFSEFSQTLSIEN
ncbi:hypothetical protein PPERSA_12552 [Pseudocohnilembus persalinus]|uniref:EF-hand domain-containing protein n=1 Tax=Pseudocohnilembus persalinus TaxID=266149 RepID=A0A0V0Q8G4_PSEPJ|nr:hypothetical protein PPERSA_12552 [Pseudocohnilembus persalinus]|eukprot:KRW98443.1 hypothetical protein PPERSA_12552 [Pseudocohnilembus persalinus]